jgi:hypothetical protein
MGTVTRDSGWRGGSALFCSLSSFCRFSLEDTLIVLCLRYHWITMRSPSVLPRSVEQRPTDGDLPLRGRSDGGERTHGEVQRVRIRTGHALVRDGDHDALAVLRVRDVERLPAPCAAVPPDVERGDVGRVGVDPAAGTDPALRHERADAPGVDLAGLAGLL